MAHNPHNLQLTILWAWSANPSTYRMLIQSYLEPLILQDSLDGRVLAARGHLGLKHHAERPVAHDLALRVRDLLGLPCQAILDLFADDLWVA